MDKTAFDKLSVRVLFLFIVHFVFKIGDQSINVFSEFTFRGFVFSVYFILFWLLVWFIAEFFNSKIQEREVQTQTNKNLHTFLLFTFHLIFGFVFAFLANYIYRVGDISIFDNSKEWSTVSTFNPELTISLLLIYMMVFSYDNYNKSIVFSKEAQIEFEKLKQESTLAQYLNLKSQVEPHFLFNSLSVLTSMIHTDADLASEFTLRLSRIFRYIVEKNDFHIVSIKEEISFAENYLFLMQARFVEGIVFKNTLDSVCINSCYIPPASLQLLIENAIKHNKFNAKNPLKISITQSKEYIIVTNNLRPRNDYNKSTKQGLINLQKRYAYFTNMPVNITEAKTEFTVAIPILNEQHYERTSI